MERVLGIGGIFFRARDPRALGAWYRDVLGIDVMPPDGEGAPWFPEAGVTIFSPHPADTEYFGRMDQTTMLNFRVSSLDAMLAQLRAAGANVDEDVQEAEGLGRFGWAFDPEGNRFELWEPATS